MPEIFLFCCSDPNDEPVWYIGPGWYRRYSDGGVEWAGFTEEQAKGE